MFAQLRPLLLSLSFAAGFAAAAAADPIDRVYAEVRAGAGALSAAVDAGADAEFEARAAAFAAAAKTAGATLDAEGGPGDLACIYRGLSAEISNQLERLAAAADAASREQALDALKFAFDDAILVTPEPKPDAPADVSTASDLPCATPR